MSDDAPRPASRDTPRVSADRWAILEPLIDAAVELAPEQRLAFLREACHGDATLEKEVESLLSKHQHGYSPIDRPAAERFASLFSDDMARLPSVLGGDYRIEREIGRGGTAIVYLARDLRHDRNVAVKVLQPDLAAMLGAERFLAEIRTTAQLQHPHILPLYDSGEDGGFVFFVMPVVEGESLRHRLEREKQLPVDEAVRIGCDVASALEAAHSRGIIHRDIKPENILLDNGSALVADFGIALAVSEAAPRLTQPGLALGTPLYMSPEQATGNAPVDNRADVYALGTVVYEMLAGEPPFMGATSTAVLAKRAVTPAPLLRILRAAVNPSIEAAVARALAREPADRYRTAADFGQALQHATSVSQPRRSRRAVLGVLAGLAAILLIGWWTVWHVSAPRNLDATRIVVLPFGYTGADSTSSDLAENVAVQLAPLFTGEGGPKAVDSRTAVSTWHDANGTRTGTVVVARKVARRLGAAKALFGSVVISGERVTLTADIVDAMSGESRAVTPVDGRLENLPALREALTKQVLVRLAGVPERMVAELTSEPLPALRAYLDGIAAYRRTRNAEAIRAFNRALDIDSTFARAGLDLAVATGRLLRRVVCPRGNCSLGSPLPGFNDIGSMQDDASFARGVRLAQESSAKLGSKDLPMLDALAGKNNQASDASETLAALQLAALAAPDRADTQYLLGLVMLNEGRALGYSDALEQAEGYLSEARRMDPGYLAPRARLVDIAAYRGDSDTLRRIGAEYLALDSTGATADYVRWRVAVGTHDDAMLRRIRARFDSLDLATLRPIITASQMSGIALDDADRAAMLVIRRTADWRERANALYWASTLALNRGRPHRADSLLRLRAQLDTTRNEFWASTTLAVLFGDGLIETARQSAREREPWLARQTAPNVVPPANTMIDAGQQILWDLKHERIDEAKALVSWIRLHGDPARPRVQARIADVASMLIATITGDSGAAAMRERVYPESRRGCCMAPTWILLALASAYEVARADSAALATLRRAGRTPANLSTVRLWEGRLADKLGDRQGALRAYEHYLALRSNPEKELEPLRDSVLNRVEEIKRSR